MFNKLWTINFSHDSLLIFSTGRSPHLFCQLWVSAPNPTPGHPTQRPHTHICSTSPAFLADNTTPLPPSHIPPFQDEAPLLNPNVLICSVGTEIFYRTPDGSLVPDQAWEAYLDQGWDRASVEGVAANFPQLKQQVRGLRSWLKSPSPRTDCVPATVGGGEAGEASQRIRLQADVVGTHRLCVSSLNRRMLC